MKYRDIVLFPYEVEQLRNEFERRGVDLSTKEGQALGKEIEQEFKDGIWANRDYVYGQDEGEPPKGAQW